MDNYIENLLKIVDYENGVYIECGANDGITQSYTYELEKRNWIGILVEPSIQAYQKCIKNRSNRNIFINCALVSDNIDNTIFGDFDGNLMSSVGGKRLNRTYLDSVPCRTLTSILDEYKVEKIDLFSLDVEGYELEVLKGLDFNKYSPNYLLIEIYSYNFDELFIFLRERNYDLIISTTNFNYVDNPFWDGTHNDYLFKKIL
jgi:FkbM family methyltransferase